MVDPALSAGISAVTVALVTVSAALLNRRNVARVTDADAAHKRADAADVLVDTAMSLVSDARAQAATAAEERSQLERMYRVALRRLEVALAYIHLLRHAIELEGRTPPPAPPFDPDPDPFDFHHERTPS